VFLLGNYDNGIGDGDDDEPVCGTCIWM